MNLSTLPRPLRQLLELQEHVASREQVLGAGVTSTTLQRLVDSGQFRRLHRGIYTTAPDDTWPRSAWAGVLLVDGAAVLGRESALHLHGLGAAPDELALWVGRSAWPAPRPGIEFLRGSRRSIGLLPHTRVEDTVLDLAGRLSPDALCRLVADAVSQHKTSAEALRRAMAARTRQANRALLAELVAEVGQGVRSPLERRYLSNVERAHGLPTGTRQWRDQDGLLCDVGYDGGLLIELDGSTYHRGARSFDDMGRDNRHALRGQLTYRFGWPHATAWRCESASLVSAALLRLTGRRVGRPCRDCRRVPFGQLST